MAVNSSSTFDDPSTKAFWEDKAKGMALPPRTVAALKDEGIEDVTDLAEFAGKDGLQAVFMNLRKPESKLENNVLIPQPPFKCSAKSQKRLVAAVAASFYYDSTDRALTPSNMSWDTLKNFEIQFAALLSKKKEASPSVPVFKQRQSFIKFLDVIMLYLDLVYGVRNCPLAYVVRNDVIPSATPPALLPNQPHSEEYGSIIGEMTHRLSHDHPLFRMDNAAVFDILEEALRGTTYAATIVRFRRTRDGRGALMALKAQHAGKAVWEKVLKDSETYMTQAEYTGTTSLTFANHADKHRTGFVNLTEAAVHVPYQVPNERTRVTHLLDSLKCQDAEFLASVTSVKLDDKGMRENFETAVAFIAPACPVSKKTGKSKSKNNAEIASAGFNPTLKTGKGKTGVELRWFPRKEYQELKPAQKDELREWIATLGEGGLDTEKAKYLKKHGNQHGNQNKKKNDGGQGNFSRKKLKGIVKGVLAEGGIVPKGDTKSTKAAREIASLVREMVDDAKDGKGEKKSTIGATEANIEDKLAISLQGIMKRSGKGKKS